MLFNRTSVQVHFTKLQTVSINLLLTSLLFLNPGQVQAQTANVGVPAEAEAGTVQNPVRQNADSTASGGKYEQFGYALSSFYIFPSKSNPSDYRSHADFIVRCELAKKAKDDPIVYPGQPGASHMHVFVGNLSTDAFSTQTTLDNAATNCFIAGDTATYWMPELYDQNGNVVDPYEIRAYYRAGTLKKVAYTPHGLRIVAGDSHATSPQPASIAGWQCRLDDGTSASGNTVPKQSTIPSCPSTNLLEGSVVFPNCWDGVNLDSADHKSHMSYSNTSSDTCDSAHPVRLAQLTLAYRYPPGKTNSKSYLSAMNSSLTLHADFWNSWKQNWLEILIDRCVNGGVECQTVIPSRFPGPMPSLTQPAAKVTPIASSCAPLSAELGTVALNVNVPIAGNYTFWSRMMSSDKDANAYYLQVDGGCPVEISTTAAANAWQWVNHMNGSSTQLSSFNLTAGNHAVKLIGKNYLTKVDKVMAINNTCIPTGTGSNCQSTTGSGTPSPSPVASPTPSPSPSSSPKASPSPVVSPSPSPQPTSCDKADINQDKVVNLLDYSILTSSFLKTPIVNLRADINQDNQVNLLDYSLLTAQFLKQCP